MFSDVREFVALSWSDGMEFLPSLSILALQAHAGSLGAGSSGAGNSIPHCHFSEDPLSKSKYSVVRIVLR